MGVHVWAVVELKETLVESLLQLHKHSTATLSQKLSYAWSELLRTLTGQIERNRDLDCAMVPSSGQRNSDPRVALMDGRFSIARATLAGIRKARVGHGHLRT